MTTTPADAQHLWRRLEPYHAVTYFAPEPRAAFEAVGLTGFWRGYFGGRAAPFAPQSPGLAAALFYVFAPAMVARAIPDIWRRAAPNVALHARLEGVDRVLTRVLDVQATDIATAAALARAAVDAADVNGHPVFAANAALDWPDEPHLALWQAATALREHRGDGHVHTLAAHGVSGCEALVLHAATGVPGREHLQANRGWDDEQWHDATVALVERGWLAADGTLTRDGAAGRRAIEDDTDRLALVPYARLGRERVDALAAALEAITQRLASSDVMPYPNPMGVPRP